MRYYPSRHVFGLLVNFTVLLLGAGLLFKNLDLRRQNDQLTSELNRTQQVQIFQSVPDLNGIDLYGQEIASHFNHSKVNLILVTSATCPFCVKNWPAWSSILNSQHGKSTPSYVIDLSKQATVDYVKDHGLQSTIFFHQIDPKIQSTYKLNVTPQTIIVGDDNRVRGVWTGVLTDSDQREIVALL